MTGLSEPKLPVRGDLAVTPFTLTKASALSNDEIVDCTVEADINQSGGANPRCEDMTIGEVSIWIDCLSITGPTLGLAECLMRAQPLEGVWLISLTTSTNNLDQVRSMLYPICSGPTPRTYSRSYSRPVHFV